jgi:hypothetical protein
MCVDRYCSSGGGNVVKKEAENILKYKDLTIEIQRVRNVRNESGTSTRATGTISKSLRKTHRENTTSKIYREKPYWVLRTFVRKYYCKSVELMSWEIMIIM